MTIGRADERGVTLIEVIISVAILGIAVVGLLGGMITAIGASHVHRQQADVEAVLASAGEAVENQNRTPYKACATPADYAPTRGWNIAFPSTSASWSLRNIQVISVSWWNGSSFQTAQCLDSLGITLQLVTINVTDPANQASITRSFVKGLP